MQLTYLSSAAVLIKDQDSSILCDPWFIDGEYYGSWCHYPPCTIKLDELNNVDGIFITHIHPDHFSVKTLEKMNKQIPIFIHKFQYNFLKKSIENLGFNVIEVEHNKRVNIKKNLHIRILASDNCDPRLCFKYFGCGIAEKVFGSTTLDTLCVIDNGDEVIVNTNDCPFPIAEDSALKIKNCYKKINFLLLGYSSASGYPQCFNLSNEELEKSKKEIVQKYLSQGESYINLFKPNYYMPFAGRYVLGGKKSTLEKDRAKIDLEDALKYFQNSSVIQQKLHKGLILNQNASFDITTGELDTKYVPIGNEEKIRYIENELTKRKYDYEDDNIPTLNNFLELIPKCYERFESKRKQLSFSSNTKVLIQLPENNILLITVNGKGFTIIPLNELNKINEFLMIKTDYRLLLRLLSGPKFAHWNNAEIGSHLEFIRNPNIYERGLFYCLNFFHS